MSDRLSAVTQIVGPRAYRVALLLTLSKLPLGMHEGRLTESHRVEVESFMAWLGDDGARGTFEAVACGDMNRILIAYGNLDQETLDKAASDGYDFEQLNAECRKIKTELGPALVN